MKFNIIFHITTYCNFDCSYCDVIKDNKKVSLEVRENIIKFIFNNQDYIETFKFFWWEPLIAFDDIKYIINNNNLEKKYSLVTNTSLIEDKFWVYLENYFKILFFSIDTENKFYLKKVTDFIKNYNLYDKVYFNLIISPWEELDAYKNFLNLYKLWFKKFNILPVYFTKSWTKLNLKNLTSVMKKILDLTFNDKDLLLYWFMENDWTKTNLFNNVIFVDIDWKIYYSDLASTYYWKEIKEDLFLWNVWDFSLSSLENHDFKKEENAIKKLEDSIYKKVSWQKELHKVMDYFSVYLNEKNGK